MTYLHGALNQGICAGRDFRRRVVEAQRIRKQSAISRDVDRRHLWLQPACWPSTHSQETAIHPMRSYSILVQYEMPIFYCFYDGK
jgi:hypothetical protein